jgi:hypothetical protein
MPEICCSTRIAVPERLWVQFLLPSTEVEPGFSTFGGMLVPVLQLISPVCKTGTSLYPFVTTTYKIAKWHGDHVPTKVNPKRHRAHCSDRVSGIRARGANFADITGPP